ncbi:MAG: hypothetical protein HQ582_28870 [Planctomycetes bacterium]|nr:hypothetical protein [Planctomycetota bacterium]
MSDVIRLDEFISLGHSLCIVANPQPWHVNLVSDEIGKFLRQLTVCGMSRARIAAQPLDGIKIPYDTRTGFIGGVALKQLQAYMESTVETLFSEAREQQVVAISTGAVSQRVRDVSQAPTLTESQVQLLDETVRCLERGAHRAAIVMGWCFAYDVARRWVFDDQQRLQSFNTELASYAKRNGARQYDDIVNYEDFFSNKAPAEGRVIEICEASGLIGGKVGRNLRHYLDVRNDYAHATSSHPTANQANAFVEHLLDIISTSPYTA